MPDREAAPEPRNPPPSGGSGYNGGMAVFSYIIGGTLVWSLIGWGLDTLLKTSWFVLVGALLGIAGGLYLAGKHGLFSPQRGPAKTESGDDDVEGNGGS
ncbi:AtpZ/AtpI family protein [Sinomonas humi]|uniref:AtpZ/AtpI family protein n=1 Tax=Sinomonas humi TaxID=1338436 RepID=UPI00068C97F2|nr:AtpZ/AtpI family protein [Sinomonas humi]